MCELNLFKYNYYKNATAVSTGTDTFEMSDPMFVVYYTVAQLTKEEGNAESLSMASQKLEAMKVRNEAPAYYQDNSMLNPTGEGFGI